MRPNSVIYWFKIVEHLQHQKILVFCVCIVMYTYSIKTWSIIDVETIKYDV